MTPVEAAQQRNRAAAPEANFVQALDRMMVQLRSESLRASATIRNAYRQHMSLLFLDQFDDVQGALATGGLAPLPSEPLQFNLMPRLHGAHPIGEKDLGNQGSYVAARPATIGMLLDVASRVKSGPLEITSLVRHGDYQQELRQSNKNAVTSVPMHTMGLAVDIALINTPLQTVYEIRDVLLDMQKAGDLLFIGERRQLVFHVVPHPTRLGYFTDRYTDLLGSPPAVHVAHVSAPAPVEPRADGEAGPHVITDIAALRPASEAAYEWWFGTDDDVASEAAAESDTAPAPLLAGLAPPLAGVAGARPFADPVGLTCLFLVGILPFGVLTSGRARPAGLFD